MEPKLKAHLFQSLSYFLQATGVTAFAHFDEYLRQQRLEAFVEKFKNSVFHRTYYSYEDEDLNSELWEWDEIEEEEEEESQEVDQGTQCLKIPKLSHSTWRAKRA